MGKTVTARAACDFTVDVSDRQLVGGGCRLASVAETNRVMVADEKPVKADKTSRKKSTQAAAERKKDHKFEVSQ